MNSHHQQLEPELDALLATGREIHEIPDIVRARALSRARSSAQASVASRTVVNTSARRRVLLLAVAASMVLAVGVAGAVVGIQAFKARSTPSAPAIAPRVIAPAPVVAPAPPVPAAALPQVPIPAKPQRPARSPMVYESYAAELELLHRAQAAYAGRDFADALTVVAEHRRRFPNGRLTEEREALRVRALTGAGRSKEARAAAASFAERFPRSVLLPRLTPESN